MRFRRHTVGWFEPPAPHRRPRLAPEAKRGQSVGPEPIERKAAPFALRAAPPESRGAWGSEGFLARAALIPGPLLPPRREKGSDRRGQARLGRGVSRACSSEGFPAHAPTSPG